MQSNTSFSLGLGLRQDDGRSSEREAASDRVKGWPFATRRDEEWIFVERNTAEGEHACAGENAVRWEGEDLTMRKVMLGLIDGDIEVFKFVTGSARVVQSQGGSLIMSSYVAHVSPSLTITTLDGDATFSYTHILNKHLNEIWLKHFTEDALNRRNKT
ncbi:uncharacterized protein ARMOST_19907 [Armillaria ostoyae]|uniref:Uncharacterized protein n=1 Tax=Armillaria ostoyae TaxID=47428 RepID=A0A284S5U9_ARMOS|nr:uncharacterized protein ARMOST_12293 [Armillaria ostoyae]SJL16383.1 uncharacterized protein ARMOST_19907 [Armillaria ostoyae]